MSAIPSTSVSAEDISHAAHWIWNNLNDTYETQFQPLFDKILAQRKTKELFEGLFGRPRWYEQTVEEEMGDVLDDLEALMPFSSLLGCVLMARLFPMALHYRMEYISDSVIVWIMKSRSAELRSQLELLAEEEADEHLRKRYRDWIWVMRPENLH